MDTVIRYSLNIFVAIIEVFLIYYFADAFFERKLKKACYLIGSFIAILLFFIDSYSNSIWITVAGFIFAILVIVFSSYGGFKEFLPKILISVFIYWIISLGETIPAMLCMLLFGETNYALAIQNSLALYAIAYISGKLFAFLLTHLVKLASKKQIVMFKLKYKVLLLICPTISFLIYIYWSNIIYYGLYNDYLFTLGLAVSLFIINLMNIKLLNWICEEAEENAKNSMVQDYLKNERKHIIKIDERNNEIRKMSHDLRHHMLTMVNLLSSQQYNKAHEYAQNLTSGVAIHTKTIDTGNTLIDSVINEYIAQAEQNDINFELEINLHEKLPIDEISIVIILGNALKNAVEYCIKEKMNLIKANIRNNDRFLMIDIINKLTIITPEMKVGVFKTNKPDSFTHGIGLHSIKETVKSLDGELSIEIHDEHFVLSVIIPLE
ncbi:MAG TPA: GHKL domain-containing protein [Oscillospiraceae bacterium]|nr:GHKL domain-containing protein [Oscillospiraceae bacterium]